MDDEKVLGFIKSAVDTVEARLRLNTYLGWYNGREEILLGGVFHGRYF